MNERNVPLPMGLPTTMELMDAVSQIIRDVQSEFNETDQQTAERLGVTAATICNARNKKAELKARTIAAIGRVYGAQAISPYSALYGATTHGVASLDAAPLSELAEAQAALLRSKSPKGRFDALPALKTASEALAGYIISLERWRTAA